MEKCVYNSKDRTGNLLKYSSRAGMLILGTNGKFYAAPQVNKDKPMMDISNNFNVISATNAKKLDAISGATALREFLKVYGTHRQEKRKYEKKEIDPVKQPGPVVSLKPEPVVVPVVPKKLDGKVKDKDLSRPFTAQELFPGIFTGKDGHPVWNADQIGAQLIRAGHDAAGIWVIKGGLV